MSNYQNDLEYEVNRRTEALKNELENLQKDIKERQQTEEKLQASKTK